MSLGMTVLLFSLGVLVYAFFSGYEAAFLAANPIRLRHQAEKENHAASARLVAYMENPDRLIALLFLGGNLALVTSALALTWYAGPVWAAVVAIPVFLIVGEIVPRSVFRAYPTQIALALLPVVRAFDFVLSPVTAPVSFVLRGFIRAAGKEQREIRSLLNTSDDVRVLVDETAEQGGIDHLEKEMIHSVMDLHSRHVREVMAPRIRIKALPVHASRRDLVAMLRETGHTRIPVYEESIDQITGVISAFAVLTDTEKDVDDIRRFVQPIMHVPDSMRLDDLLEAMRQERTRIAIVTDEYGGTDGIITVEDILEEIFGEIHDEHDKDEQTFRKVGVNAWTVDARVPLTDAAEALGLPLHDDDVETIAGWVMRLADRIPAKGETFTVHPWKIQVLDGGPNFIGRIRLEVLDPDLLKPAASAS